MQHRFRTYCMLVVSIIVLIAGAFPHHHHEERFCLNTDLSSCTSPLTAENETHYPGDADSHTCKATCVTHFSFSSPSNRPFDFTPDYTFYFLTYPLLDVLEHYLSSGVSAKHVFYYIERLHGLYCVTVRSLRAPPALS